MRKLLSAFVISCLFGLLPLKTFATVEQAQHFVEGVSNQALSVVQTEALSDGEKFKKLSDLFAASVDTNWMGRFALGLHWRNFNTPQKQEYLTLYQEFLLYSYVPKFREYNNQNINIKKVSSNNAHEYTIQTEITSPEGKVYRVDYRIHKDPQGKYKIFDVIGEGVSLITTQRSDFSSLLADKGADYFTSRLKERISQLKASS
jgi:phospholipid transport system substrate-binding protein